jgi:hypothetical protein
MSKTSQMKTVHRNQAYTVCIRVVQLLFFPPAKNSLIVGPKGEETPPGTIFEN